MAEAVVSFAVERLGDLLISEAKLLYGVSDQIEELQRELKRMQRFLSVADKKQIDDDRVRGWVEEIRELAFKTEDVIETFALDVATKRQKSGLKEMLRRFACIVSEGASLHKIGTEIQAIRGRLSGLTATLPTYGITKGLEEGETSNSVNLRNRRIFYSHITEKDFVGMEKEMEEIISHLKKADKGCEVVSICGMGGQGKTTLATQLYNHPQVKAHFKAFAWVCITQQFDTEKVLQSIVEQLLPEGRKAQVSSMGDEVLVYELYKFQQERNCLVVFDDIWTVDAWLNLCPAFPVGVSSCGSKILLTTRNMKVAEVGSVYKLRGLTEEEGWQLISKKASLVTEDSTVKGETAEMESIGRKMVKRCKGLPLAISTLGGMLRGKSLREWETINKDISFYLSRGSGIDEYHTVTQVLGLSYDTLPPRLQQCFLYLANYKEDERINAEKLYLLWIAEGFVSTEDKAPGEMMLNVAERYLDELAHRSLVQFHPHEAWKSWSKFESCSVHDVIRDLCLSKVKEEKVIRIVDLQQKRDHGSNGRNDRIRRLCVHVYDSMDESSVDQNVIAYVRSLLLITDDNVSNHWMENIFSLEKFKFLRVLTIKGFELSEKIIKSTEKLVFLKYLSFNGCRVGELPSSIGNLRNLETLDLRVNLLDKYNKEMIPNCRIPNVMWKFKQLQHLYLPYLYKISESVDNNDQKKLRLNGLNELELIEGFKSEVCETHDLIRLRKIQVFKGRIRVDEENPNVIESTIKFINSNKLCYSDLYIHVAAEVGESVFLLFECPFIDSLDIFGRITALPNEYDLNRFSRRLTKLSLYVSEIEEFNPMILLEKLVNLRSLLLGMNSYMGRELVCSATGFPQLESLALCRLPNLESWIIEEGAMPNLSVLNIQYCNELEMLPDGLKFLTALQELGLWGMRHALNNRVRVINGVEGPDFHKVSHVPAIIVH